MPDPNRKRNEQKSSAIVLIIDRLSAGAIGPYGNTSIDTPELNRWAASGVLFDHVVANGIELNSVYESWWRKWIENGRSPGSSDLLFTDDPLVASHPAAESFSQVQLVESPESDADSSVARSAADTQMAAFFAQATETLARFEHGSLVWMHSKGMSEYWDAPMDYRVDQCGPDDPDPPDFFKAPSQWIDPADADPDQLLGIEQAYAAQIILLDQLLGIFGETLRNDARFTDTWLILASPRGYPLGNHGIVGDAVDPHFAGTKLHHENLHVPLIVCPPATLTNRFATGRCSRLLESSEITNLLDRIFAGEGEKCLMEHLDGPHDSSFKSQIVTQHDSAESVLTKDWKLISDGKQHQLFSKPDDRWEVNNVADRCPKELEQMQNLLCETSGPE
jgi:hypothetical protein